MTLERFAENIERIANALEVLAQAAENKGKPVMALDVNSFRHQPETSAPITPEPVSVMTVPTPAAPSVDADPLPRTAEELRDMVQLAASKMDKDVILDFTKWVREVLCAKFNVKKIVEIPTSNLADAGRMFIAEARKRGINV